MPSFSIHIEHFTAKWPAALNLTDWLEERGNTEWQVFRNASNRFNSIIQWYLLLGQKHERTDN
jgi:hypothetical protein